MAARRRHVDLLADIYRRLALIYNVTNYVAVGTNQILKLVYSLSQELLLRDDQSHASTVRSAKGAPNMGINVNINPTNRIANWVDVFVYYPRAYLLISTSVDYSLSVGRLPHDNDIPDSLRNILPDTPKITLPWMTKTELINPTNAAGPDFWCPSYCAPARPLSIIRPQTDGLALPSSTGGSMVGTCKPPLQLQTMPGTLWQDGSGYDSMYNYRTTPVTFEQGPINLDFLNPMPPTPVPFFQPSASQPLGYGQYGQIGAIPTPVMGNEIGGSGDLEQVYMTDDDSITPSLWVLDYYNETASNGPSMFYSLAYPPPPHNPTDDHTQSSGSSV